MDKPPAKRKRTPHAILWGQTELLMLGRWPDAEIAHITCRTLDEVVAKRKELKLPPPKTAKS